MAIKKESLLKMAGLLKIDSAKIEEALAATTDVELAIDDSVTVFSKTELDTRDRAKYSEGKKAGEGMTIDGLFEEEGIQVTGKKDAATFKKEYSAKILKDANVSVDEKVKEKDNVISKLRENYKTLEQQLNDTKKASQDALLEADILSWTLDKKPDHLTNKEWVTIIKMNNDIVEHEGKLVVKRNGEIVSDPKELKPIAAKDAIVSFIDDRKLGKVVTAPAPPIPGRGAGDSKRVPGTIVNMKQFKENLATQGINANGQQAKAMLKEITDANPQFDFNEN
jgi:hypothetical protein